MQIPRVQSTAATSTPPSAEPGLAAPSFAPSEPRPRKSRLSDLSAHQWRSGIAAWLGWLFDGLDMHLYTLVATPFVAQLLGADPKDEIVTNRSGWIQAAFLMGWALGGGFFGRLGDRLGRSRALVLTILTYACFTGISFFAMAWWHLLIFRFVAALGIGGEWAVGAALLSETWPKQWRPWMAAVLQSGVNIGVVLAMIAGHLLASAPYRCVFLVGVLPALIVVWIRRAVPEPDAWHAARADAGGHPPITDLFRGPVARITVLTILVCSLSLTAHWAFMFWSLQHLRNLPDVASMSTTQKTHLAALAMSILMVSSIMGNFLAAWFARLLGGYRWAIAVMCVAYFLSITWTYSQTRPYTTLLWMLPMMGVAQGVFALFTMYMPPLFPVLLRTTGAGFCYNIGRIAAALGTVYFGNFAKVGDYGASLWNAGFLFLPAALFAVMLPEPTDEVDDSAPLLEPTE